MNPATAGEKVAPFPTVGEEKEAMPLVDTGKTPDDPNALIGSLKAQLQQSLGASLTIYTDE